MSMTQSLLIRGMPGSPYTRKMVALLRYRHIPYRWLLARNAASHGLPAAKVELLPTLYFRDDRGELEAVVDSTPSAESAYIRRMDRRCCIIGAGAAGMVAIVRSIWNDQMAATRKRLGELARLSPPAANPPSATPSKSAPFAAQR